MFKNLRRSGLLLSASMLFCCVPWIRAQQMPILALTDPSPKTADASVKVPVYEIASVKENKGGDGTMRWSTNPDGFSTVNLSLQSLIANAYGIRQDLISGGPAWSESRGFDVDAKVAGTDVDLLKRLTPRQRASMLQPILVERFKLKIHLETKQLPVYELVVMKGGVKFKQAVPDPPADALKDVKDDPSAKRNGSMTMGPGMFSGTGLSVGAIANQLSYAVQRSVIDKTGLTGKYDLDLKWSTEDGPKQDNGATDTSPSIFTAVQEQLGLKLQSTKGPVDTLVIDHVELPSEN